MPPLTPYIPSFSGFTTSDNIRHTLFATPTGRLNDLVHGEFLPIDVRVEPLACFDLVEHVTGFISGDDNLSHAVVATIDGNIVDTIYEHRHVFALPPLLGRNDILAISGFYSPDDQMRNIIVATLSGSLIEIRYDSLNRLQRPIRTLATFSGITHIAAFHAADDNMRIVIVATQDGNLTEVFYNNAVGIHITNPPLANFQEIVDIGAFYATDNNHRVVAVATRDGNIGEVFYHPRVGIRWVTLPGVNFPDIFGIAAFYSPADALRRITVMSKFGSVNEIRHPATIGARVDFVTLTILPLVKPEEGDFGPHPYAVDRPTFDNLTEISTCGRVTRLAAGSKLIFAATELAGIWGRSLVATNWFQLHGSPTDGALPGPAIAVDPKDDQHLIAGTKSGVWESSDLGRNFTMVFDPTSAGCARPAVTSVAFAQDGSTIGGADCGIARRPPGRTGFDFTPTAGGVLALDVSETKVWARTLNAILFSSDSGTSWSSPIATPAGVSFDYYAAFSLAAFDDFVYLPFSVPGKPQPAPCGQCGADVMILIYNVALGRWATQNVDFGGCHVCDGTGLGGRKFVRSFVRKDAGLPNTVGKRRQLFYGVGQALLQADSTNSAGTIARWNMIAETSEAGAAKPDVHVDIWDCLIDVQFGGSTAWIASDGGVAINTLASPFNFSGGGWKPTIEYFPALNAHGITVLPINAVATSRLAFPTSDNEAWCRDAVLYAGEGLVWQAVEAGGDVNFSIGDATHPEYVLLARHRQAGTFKDFTGKQTPLALLNYKFKLNPDGTRSLLSTPGPDSATTIQFIQAPRGKGSRTLKAVMMVDLPLTFWSGTDNVPFDVFSPLGKSSGGKPVLIRTHDFAANPDINTSKGAGWEVEIASLPDGTRGFYVTGTPAKPVYYTYGDGGFGLFLWQWSGGSWGRLPPVGLLESPAFGPTFVNPYSEKILYTITSAGILWSFDGGMTNLLDPQLTNLVSGSGRHSFATLVQIAFNFENPLEAAAVTSWGGIFYSPNPLRWIDLSGYIDTPFTPLTGVGIDCYAIYAATEGRGIIGVVNHKAA